MTRRPVLMYHGLHAGPGSRGVFEPTYSVDPSAFALQLDWLVAQGITTRRLQDEAPPDGRSVVLTFDDGDTSNAEIALPLLLERGMVAEFFITTDFVGRPGMVDAGQLLELAEAGMGIQSHGRTHRHLAGLTGAELREELRTSRRVLEDLTCVPVDALSLPGGRGGAREDDVARQHGYRWVLTSTPGPNRSRDERPERQRIPVTRGLPLEDFAALVHWRGWPAARSWGRTTALEVPKQLLGDARYDRLRTVLRSRLPR